MSTRSSFEAASGGSEVLQELARKAELLGITFRVHSTSPLTTQLAMVLYSAMRQMPELTRFMTGVDMYSYGMAIHLGRLGTILVTPEGAKILLLAGRRLPVND